MVASVGLFTYPVRIYSPDLSRSEELHPLVDTGSLFTWAPAAMLRRLGIAPGEEIPFKLANGQLARRAVADVLVEIDSVRHITAVVFGEPGDMSLLGGLTLERFLLMPDVVHQLLVPIIPTAA